MILTPQSRSEETTTDAMHEGFASGMLTMIPSAAMVGLAYYRSAAFRLHTNVQSRTALIIMPSLFMYAFASEERHRHKMMEIAEESKHNQATVEWAEQYHQKSDSAILTQMYQQSILNQNGPPITVVPQLQWYHRLSNYTAENPVKVLSAIAVPAVAYIFYGRKNDLEVSKRLMHTRVYGQFTTIGLLLSIMGFKSYVDSQGKFMSQDEHDARIRDMQQVREEMMARLDAEEEHQHEMQRAVDDARAESRRARHHKKHSGPVAVATH